MAIWTWLARACRAAFDSAWRSATSICSATSTGTWLRSPARPSDGVNPSGSVISCRMFRLASSASTARPTGSLAPAA